ncbi:MAG: VWA domain-containing protein [Planctomycetes bacterium]|nr:VWA domain-containing protein [Planctomycetota bacterium]
MRCVLVVLAGLLMGVVVLGCAESRGPGDSAATVESEASAVLYDVDACVGEGADGVAYSEPRSAPEASEATPSPTASDDSPASPRSRPSPAKREAEVVRRDVGPEPPAIRRSHIQSGTLTAGSFDDNRRFDDYQAFLSKAMQADTAEKLPRVAIGQRVMIHVSGAGGGPVGDARVVIREATGRRKTDAGGPVLLDLSTGSDGRAMLLTGLDAGGGSGKFLVTVHPPDEAEPITQVMHVDQQPWRIKLPDTRARLPRRLDLALVVDCTGSMSDELEYLKVEIDSIAKRIYQLFPNVDQRYSLIAYRDDGDRYVTRTFDFTGSLAEFRATLSEQSAQGGGNYPEAMHLALENANRFDWRDRDTARVLFLVADAPPHDRFAGRTLDAVEALRERGVRVFPVAASGTAIKAEFVMRSAGFLTLGQYLFLTDHSGVGNPHAEPHVPDYQVERLDRLMIRMIASELAGRRLAADEVIAVKGGGPWQPQPYEDPVDEQQRPRAVHSVSRELSATNSIPRWAVLAAAVLGLCVVDSLLTRRRS